jgi:O-antigen/teichoic acid export membrane protein
LFLVRYVTDADLALYAVAIGLASLMGLFQVAFQAAWGPFSFSVMGREGAGLVYARTLTMFTAIGGMFTVGLALFAPELLLGVTWLSGKSYGGSAASVGPLAFGFLLGGMYLVVQTGAHIVKNTRVIAATTGLAALINVALNFWWIPAWGIIGAALATAAGYLAATAVLYVIAQRLAHIPYELARVLVTLAVCMVLLAVAPWIQTGALWSDLVLKLVLCAGYGLALAAARVVLPADVRRLTAAVRARLAPRA